MQTEETNGRNESAKMKQVRKSGFHEKKIGHREKTEATPRKLTQIWGRHGKMNNTN
jgi:hypothetical protein